MRSQVAALAVILTLWLAGTVHAQSPNASVTGRVTDPSKAVIKGAKVTLINSGTHFTYEGVTNETGSYYVTDVLPGTYTIQVTKAGFKTGIEASVVLHVQDTLEFNFDMAVGSVSESVTVKAEESGVQLATSSVSAVVDSTTVLELPLNGRSWTDLATLDPGVDSIPSQAALRTRGPTRGNRGFGNQITISGSLPQFNNYRLDGVSINDYSNGGPGSVQGGNIGVDAIQEFSVITSNPPAEYGRVAGGVVSAITRSGTDQFHGGVYEFFRNSALDARNFFDGANIPPFHQNQFGADAGGPIWKGKLFVFGDYEGLRQSTGVTSRITVPSAAARAGTLCSAPDTPPPTCSPTQITVDPSVQKYLPLWPNATSPLSGTNGDIGTASFAGQQTVDQNFFTIRLDGKMSSKDTFDGTYLRDYAPYSSPDNLDTVLITSYTHHQTVALGESHIFSPTVLNSFRFGFNREDALNHAGLTAINPLAKDPSLGAVPGENAAEVKVSGLTPFTAGVEAASFVHYFWNSFQGYDDVVWTHGTHSLKFGASLERTVFNVLSLTDPGGVFSFSTLSNFLTNQPKAFDAQFSDSASPRHLRQTIFGVFVQDDWRWRPNLTLNVGVRYEMSTLPTEVQGKLANLINLTDAQPHLGDPFFSNPTRRNLEPRIGLAWDPFRNGKTAVRAGFGMFDVLPLLYQFTLAVSQSFPFARLGSVSSLPPGSFFTGATALLGPESNEETFVESHPRRSYVMQWNFNVQRELAPSLTVTVGSVGSHGVHQPFDSDDFDMVLPTGRAPDGRFLFPNPVGSGTKINPNFGSIRGIIYDGNSSYNNLEIGVQKRMSHDVQIQSSFTWGKSIDNDSSIGIGNQFSNSISALPWYDLRSIRGPSDINVPRTFVTNGTWLIPSPKSLHGLADWIASGWELGAIYKATDGVPITPTFGANSGDPLGLNSSAPWDFPDRLTGPGCNSLTNPQNPNNYIKTQCFAVPTAPSAAFYAANCDPTFGTFPQCFNLRGNSGRNILNGPGLSNLDFSIYKNSHIKRISESFNVQFRAEFFNILNRANFAVPVAPDFTDIFDSTGARSGTAGLLTSTATTSRQIQFALKVNW
jgi:hypothetical protein